MSKVKPDKKQLAKEKRANAVKRPKEEMRTVRTYVMDPFGMVTDKRTGVKRTDIGAVLDGDLDEFMFAYLQQSRSGRLV